MPPEPPPWNRRDVVFREKKHERGSPYPDALGSGSSFPRWRETCHSGREFPTPSPRRPPSGYHRPGGGGGCHKLFPDEPCSRSEDDGFRICQSDRYFGNSGRESNIREGGGCFRRSSSDSGGFQRQPRDSVASQRSVIDSQLNLSPRISSFQEHHDKASGGVNDGSRTGQKHDRNQDHSLGSLQWKSLKWNRPGSFSFLKVVRSEPEESRLEVVVPSGTDAPAESPVVSPLPSDEGLLRKKQRLGWGQGLAKYEKEKFEVADDGWRKTSVISSGTSPRFMALSGSASPATPGSMTCSSSHGGEDKDIPRAVQNDASNNLHNSTCHDSQYSLDNFSDSSENLELSSLDCISSLIADLLNTEDPCQANSQFMKQTAVNKLMLLKCSVLSQLEKTESEIDFFENELRKLRSMCGRNEDAKMSLKVNSECERNDRCEGSSIVPLDQGSNCSKDHASIAPKVPCSAFTRVMNAEPTSELHGEINKQWQCDLSNIASKSWTPHLSYKVKETSGFATSEAIMETGAMSDAGHPCPCATGSGASCICSCAAALDVEASSIASKSEAPRLSYKEKETSGFATPEAVLETGTMSRADHPRTCATGSGTSGICSCAAASDVGANTHGISYVGYGPEFRSLIASIVKSNRESAKRASEVLDTSFSFNSTSFQRARPCIDFVAKGGSHVRENLAKHRCFLRFKEEILTLKYRAFQHLWKEDLRLFSTRKHRTKSQKRCEQNCRSLQSAPQKNRSLRSRFALSGNLSLVATSEILDFASKLLSDSHIKLYRGNLRMPALILDVREKKYSRFITSNGLIEDPLSFEEERSLINPWTVEEREIFMKMLAMYGKDFTKIACFLSHKTTADCVEFYYKNHKSSSFDKVKESLHLRKNFQVNPSGKYLISSGKNWNREENAVLDTASVLASHADDNMKIQHRYFDFGRSNPEGPPGARICPRTAAFETSSGSGLVPEPEFLAADVLTGTCGVLSEAMKSCVTSTTSLDPREKLNFMAGDQQLACEVAQSVDEDLCSDVGCGEVEFVDWTDEEKSKFMSALSNYGREFSRISRFLGSRSEEQCKIFFSKARKSLGLDAILRGALSDANIGKSDTEDACTFEIDSAMCSTYSCSKMEDLPNFKTNERSSASGQAGVDVKLEIGTKDTGNQEIERSSHEEVKIVEKPSSTLDANSLATTEVGNLCLKSEGEDPMTDMISTVSIQHDLIRGGESIPMTEMKEEKMDLCPPNEPPLADPEKGLTITELYPKRSMLPKDLDDGQHSQMHLRSEKISKHLSISDVGIVADRHLDDKVNACPEIVISSNHVESLHLPLDSRDSAEFFSQEQNAESSRFLSDALADKNHGQASAAKGSVLSFEDHGYKLQKSYIYQHLSGHPLQVLKNEDMNGQAGVCEKSVFLHYCPDGRTGERQSAESLARVSHRLQVRSGASFLLPKDNACSDTVTGVRLHSSSKDAEQAIRTGDVKLFGQILSHPPSAPSPSFPTWCGNCRYCNSGEGSSLNLLDHHHQVRALPPSRTERSPRHHHQQDWQEMPGRLWTKEVAQQVMSAVPEAGGIFLAKCPGSGLSCYTVKDYPGSRGFSQQAYLQPLVLDVDHGGRSADVQQQQQQQRHSGFGGVPGLQHQARVGLLGSRAAGIGNCILVSGKGCTGVSDPVAALKMHYAACPGTLRSEEESWRTDMGK